MGLLYWLILAFIVGVWIFSVVDIFRRYSRKQLSGRQLAVWLVIVIMIPVVGTLVYLLARPATPLEGV
jgi:hypothetical protein